MQDDFADVAPLDADYAEQRQKWERLYKATQVRGDGEAHPLLSPDEFADFETWDYGDLDATQAKTHDMLPGGYARTGLQRGLMLQDKLGVNPFKFGMVGAGDNHVSMSSPDNDDFFGRYATYEPSPHRVFSEDGTRHLALENKELGLELGSFEYITSGVTAVRATENTRGAIFDAMERREVYPTTGPRIRVRLFGGWDFQAENAQRRDLAVVGYTRGVPMGADLPAAGTQGGAPSFLVYALRDPMGADLDRVQIVKGWIDAEGNPQDKVHDVAWSDSREAGPDGKVPAVGETVNLDIPSWTTTIGASELGDVWTDPDFDPALKAFCYARVIEIPTPRRTAHDRVKST